MRLLRLCGLLLALRPFPSEAVRKFAECDKWARDDLQCVENPNFMWTQCSSACRALAKDDNEKCAGWAEEGECWANPHYIQLHCPESCGFGLAWNPYLRREMEYSPLEVPDDAPEVEALVTSASSQCQIVDLMQVADLLKARVDVYIKHSGANLPASVLGLASSAPTDFLGVYGLAEAALYSLRVYHLITSSSASAAPEAAPASAKRLEALVQAVAAGWAADPLAVFLSTRGLELLQEASDAAREAVGLPSSTASASASPLPQTCPATGEPRPPVAALGGMLELLAPSDYKGPLLAPLLPASLAPLTRSPLPAAKLRSGALMPLLGLGTWLLEGEAAENTTYLAIKTGYRHIDLAEAYSNEAAVGRAIRRAVADGLVKRSDLFLASKVSSPSSAGDQTGSLVESQLQQLGTDYFDLYYLHSPLPDAGEQSKTWAALERLQAAGKIRDLAVSNFDVPALAFFDDEKRAQPSVVQNKLDIYHHSKQLDNQGEDVLREAARRGIVTLAYSPFSSYPFALLPAHDPVVRWIAQSLAPIPLTDAALVLSVETLAELYDMTAGAVPITPAMVLVKWAAQLGLAQIPRSSDAQRLAENLLAGSAVMPPLDESHMRILSSLQLLTASPLCVAV